MLFETNVSGPGLIVMNPATESSIATRGKQLGGITNLGRGCKGSRHGLDEYLALKYCLIGGLDR